MQLLPKLQQRFGNALQTVSIDLIARNARFMQRTSDKITPLRCALAFCFLASSSHCSFSIIASILSLLASKAISKQAVKQRLNQHAIGFLHQLLAALTATSKTIQNRLPNHVFASFRRVLVQDSTSISLPTHMAKLFPGPKNQSGKDTACLKIHAFIDLITDSFLRFSFSPFTRTDQAAAPDILHLIQPHDLVMRDLGYFTLDSLHKIQQANAHFLSRLRSRVAIFCPHSDTRFPLLKTLKTLGRLDRTVAIGAQKRLLVRLVALPVPQRVANERRRKLRNNRDKRLNPSKEDLQLLNWNIFITTVPPNVWEAHLLTKIYAMRWRIEIIFKAWKSHFHIHHIPNASPIQIHALIYARLLRISILHVGLFLPLYYQILHLTGQHLSLLKFASLINQTPLELLLQQKPLDHLIPILLKHATYEKRKRTNQREEMICLA